jgi:hypothetical protein
MLTETIEPRISVVALGRVPPEGGGVKMTLGADEYPLPADCKSTALTVRRPGT